MTLPKIEKVLLKPVLKFGHTSALGGGITTYHTGTPQAGAESCVTAVI